MMMIINRSNWNLKMLVFVEGGKPEYPRSRDENQQQTQPTLRRDRESNPATLVGDERSDHCIIPAPRYFHPLGVSKMSVEVKRDSIIDNVLIS